MTINVIFTILFCLFYIESVHYSLILVQYDDEFQFCVYFNRLQDRNRQLKVGVAETGLYYMHTILHRL